MTTKTRTFKIYERDIHDSLLLLAQQLADESEIPYIISYDGVEDDHAVWQVQVFDQGSV